MNIRLFFKNETKQLINMITKNKKISIILLINIEVMNYAASKDNLSVLNRLESIFETSYHKVFQLTVYLKVSLYLKITFLIL